MILLILAALHGSPPNDGGFQAAAHVLSVHCVRCHNPDKTRGGLNLSTRETTIASGATSEVVVPGDLDHSSLYQRALAGSMPPSKDGRRLLPNELAALSRWILQGANWPNNTTLPGRTSAALALQNTPTSQQRWRQRRRVRR